MILHLHEIEIEEEEEEEGYLQEGELRGQRGGLSLQHLHLLLQLHDVPHLALLGPRRRLPVRQHPDAMEHHESVLTYPGGYRIESRSTLQ